MKDLGQLSKGDFLILYSKISELNVHPMQKIFLLRHSALLFRFIWYTRRKKASPVITEKLISNVAFQKYKLYVNWRDIRPATNSE